MESKVRIHKLLHLWQSTRGREGYYTNGKAENCTIFNKLLDTECGLVWQFRIPGTPDTRRVHTCGPMWKIWVTARDLKELLMLAWPMSSWNSVCFLDTSFRWSQSLKKKSLSFWGQGRGRNKDHICPWGRNRKLPLPKQYVLYWITTISSLPQESSRNLAQARVPWPVEGEVEAKAICP